ncbi:hypothetical protein ACFSBI_13245, partial [Amnibacterium endophyticum]
RAALRHEDDPQTRFAELRDALIAWVDSPKRAKRLFSEKAAAPAPAARRQPAPTPAPAPTQTPNQKPDDAAAAPAAVAATGAAARPAPSASEARDDAEYDEVPAWRRTRSAERLQQQRDARDEPPREDTAPVRLQRAHRADPAPIEEAEQLERVHAHQASPFSRPSSDRPRPVADEAPVAGQEQGSEQEPERPEKPEWLDDYDDEAHVTQTMNLKTPPPVSASALRDRSSTGDIVPRP